MRRTSDAHPWRDRTVLVTGASSGVGRAVATDLARRGATVGVLARSREALEELARECASAPGAVVVLPADVTDHEAVDAAVAELGGAAGLDAVVHAAGVVEIGAFADVPAEAFEATVRTNLLGTVAVARAAVPALRRRGGVLVVLGSMLGEVPAPLMSAYVTAKHGVHGLVRTLQAELAGGPPAVVLVQPSAVRTPIYRKAGTVAGAHGAPVPPVVSAARVAARVVRAVANPRRTVRVGPLVVPSVLLYRSLPAVYDRFARQASTRLGLDHRAPAPPTDGALHRPMPGWDRTEGPRTRRGLGDLLRAAPGGRFPSRRTGTRGV